MLIEQIPLQDTTYNALPQLDLILEKPPLNLEKIESDMNNEHLKEHQDNASADDCRSRLFELFVIFFILQYCISFRQIIFFLSSCFLTS